MGSGSSSNNQMTGPEINRMQHVADDEAQKRRAKANVEHKETVKPREPVKKSSEETVGSKKKKKSSEENHESNTKAEEFAAGENFKVIRDFLKKYHTQIKDPTVNEFLSVLDTMKPIRDENSKDFFNKFNGSEGLAVQHLQSLQNILNIWEKNALDKYLGHKAQQTRLQVMETSYKTIASQDDEWDFFCSKYDQNPRSAGQKDAEKSKTTVTFVGDDKEYTIQQALDKIRERKEAIDKLVLIESLHYRAIRELLKINKSNIALIQYFKPTFDDTTSTRD